MAVSAQVIAVLKYKYLEVVESQYYDHTQELHDNMCMTDSARDKDEVTKDKKMTICLKLVGLYNKMAAKVVQLVVRGGSTRLTFSNQVSLKGPNSSSLSFCLQTSAQQRLKEVHIALHRKSLKLISEFPNNTFQLQIDVC